MMNKKNKLVFVYGTLLSGFNNHNYCLKPYVEVGEAEFISVHETEPKHTMVSLGGFPAIIPHTGETSIKGELYLLKSDRVIQSLNSLEGHKGKDHPSNFYNVTEIDTPYGEATMYVLEGRENNNVVKSGNWRTK